VVWKTLWKILPGSVLGITLGWYFMPIIPMGYFGPLIGWLIIGLLVLTIAGRVLPITTRVYAWAMHLIALGMLFFCSSLYLRSSSALSGVEFAWLGPVAPIGGLLFIAGWLLAAFAFTGKKPDFKS
jgi:uncharacterized membrane protein YfcA